MRGDVDEGAIYMEGCSAVDNLFWVSFLGSY